MEQARLQARRATRLEQHMLAQAEVAVPVSPAASLATAESTAPLKAKDPSLSVAPNGSAAATPLSESGSSGAAAPQERMPRIVSPLRALARTDQRDPAELAQGLDVEVLSDSAYGRLFPVAGPGGA